MRYQVLIPDSIIQRWVNIGTTVPLRWQTMLAQRNLQPALAQRISCKTLLQRWAAYDIRPTVKALTRECRMSTHEETNDVLMHEKRMTLTKEKNNTHKQRKLHNDERPFK